MEAIQSVSLSRIHERENYRQEYDPDFVATIASDMAESGFKPEYPMTVYADGDTLILIDGHTRYHAAMLGTSYDLKTRLPLMSVWVAIKDRPTDADFKLMQLAANEQRRDPDDMSKAIGYRQALDAGATMAHLVKATGHYTSYIEDRLTLLSLVPEGQQLVAKKHMGIKFAGELSRLDSNFQRIAIQQYSKMKNPTLDQFRDVVNQLFTKQSQATLCDLALFSGKPIDPSVYLAGAGLTIEPKMTRAELETALKIEREKREKDRAYARRKYSEAKHEIERLRALLTIEGVAA